MSLEVQVQVQVQDWHPASYVLKINTEVKTKMATAVNATTGNEAKANEMDVAKRTRTR